MTCVYLLLNIIEILFRRLLTYYLPNFYLKKVYDRNIVNKYRFYLLLGVVIFYPIDNISICPDAELFISYRRITYIYIYMLPSRCVGRFYFDKVAVLMPSCDVP